MEMNNKHNLAHMSRVIDNRTPEQLEIENIKRLTNYRRRVRQDKRRKFLRICGSYAYPFRKRFTPTNIGHMYHMGALAGFVGFMLCYGWLFILLADFGVYLTGDDVVGTAVMVTGWSIVFLHEVTFYIRHIRST